MSHGDSYTGQPGYPAPYATKTPREGLRDEAKARIVSLAPDVCLTPVGNSVVPIPYPVVDNCGDDSGYTPSVRFTGQKAMVMRSNTTCAHGDEPGTKKGVKSGTVGDICEPIGNAQYVRAEGSEVIRHLDRFHMNKRNTVGEAIFVRSMATPAALVDTDPIPGSLQFAQYTQPASPQPAPPASNPPRAPGQVIRPNVPQWQRPPPTPPAPNVSPWARLRRFGIFGIFMLDMRSTPTIPFPSRNADDYERELNEYARNALDPFDAEYNNAVRDWYYEELEAYRGSAEPQAETRSDQQSEEQPVPAPLPNVRVDPKACYPLVLSFTSPANGTRSEMQRQLGLQQSALNAKNPCQAATDIANYSAVRPFGEAARTAERRRLISQRATLLQGLNPALTRTQAMTTARNWAQGKDAIHTLDMVAGGNPTAFSGLGGRSENRSIGSQWGPGGRASTLASYASNQCAAVCPTMQVSLVLI